MTKHKRLLLWIGSFPVAVLLVLLAAMPLAWARPAHEGLRWTVPTPTPPGGPPPTPPPTPPTARFARAHQPPGAHGHAHPPDRDADGHPRARHRHARGWGYGDRDPLDVRGAGDDRHRGRCR
jgi:hypothetical protein